MLAITLIIPTLSHAETNTCPSSIPGNYSIGKKSADISAFQTYLLKKGIDIPALSSSNTSKGYFGVQTQLAVKKYQASKGRVPTGLVDTQILSEVRASECGNSSPTLNVITPNGGEILSIGKKLAIKWENKIAAPASAYYDIKLSSYYPPCSSTECTQFEDDGPFTIAKKVSALTYEWNVGAIMESRNMLNEVRSGKYTVLICQTGTNNCDSSNTYFTIESNDTSYLPIIKSIVGPASVTIGTAANWTINAYDSTNQSLSYSINWGDTTSNEIRLPSDSQKNIFSHKYSKTGTYTIKVQVANKKGLTAESVTSVSVVANTSNVLTVLAPNGGEVWQLGSRQSISWSGIKNIPSTYRLQLNLSDSRGSGTLGIIDPSKYPNSVYEFTVPDYLFFQDVGGSLIPGQYKLKLTLYDGDVCLSVTQCNPNHNWGKFVAEDISDRVFTISSPTLPNTPSVFPPAPFSSSTEPKIPSIFPPVPSSSSTQSNVPSTFIPASFPQPVQR